MPAGLVSQALGFFQGSPTIASAQFACGAQAAQLRAKGYQEFSTKAGAQGVITKANSNLPQNKPITTGWNVGLSGVSGLLVRSLKVIIGGVLILSGIIRITGADKTALGVAGKAAVFA